MNKKSFEKHTGFTIIELMIAVAIISILAIVVFPSYQSSIRESRRAEAQAGLSAILLEQENYRLTNPTYASSLADITAPSSDFYTFEIVEGSATSSTYTVKATAVTGTSQADDDGCTSLTINQSDTKLPASCW